MNHFRQHLFSLLYFLLLSSNPLKIDRYVRKRYTEQGAKRHGLRFTGAVSLFFGAPGGARF